MEHICSVCYLYTVVHRQEWMLKYVLLERKNNFL